MTHKLLDKQTKRLYIEVLSDQLPRQTLITEFIQMEGSLANLQDVQKVTD